MEKEVINLMTGADIIGHDYGEKKHKLDSNPVFLN